MGSAIVLTTDRPKPYYTYTDVVQLLPAQKKALLQQDRVANAAMDRALYNWIKTQSGHHLDATCRAVLCLVITRTYVFSKKAELISTRHFMEGVFDAAGISVCAPATTNDRATYRALGILEKMKLITKQRITINGADVVSFIEPHPKAILALVKTNWRHAMLRQPKAKTLDRMTEFYNEGTVLSIDSTGVLSIDSTEDSKQEDIERSKTGCEKPRNLNHIFRTRKPTIANDCKTTVLRVIENATARTTARVVEKAQRGAGGFPMLSALSAMWKIAYSNQFAGLPMATITGIQYGKFKRIAGKHDVGAHWQELITWSVENWVRLNRKYKDKQDYRKKMGDWSTIEEGRIFLGSEMPSLHSFTENFGKLLTGFTESKFKMVAEAPTVTVAEASLHRQLAEANRRVAVADARLVGVLKRRSADVEERVAAPKAKIVNPRTDKFFDKDDEDFPDWEQQE